MDRFIMKKYLFSKGIYSCNVFSTGEKRDLLWHDDKLTDANISGSVNVSKILAGLGNAPQINLFDQSSLSVSLTAADVELRQIQLQTGGEIAYNGKTRVCELITAAEKKLVVTGEPVAPYDNSKIVAYVDGGGEAYEIDPKTKEVKDCEINDAEKHSVMYYVEKPASEVLAVSALYTPDIVSMEIKMPIFTNAVGSSAKQGTLAGYLWIIVPRAQSTSAPNISASQTNPTSPQITLEALPLDTDETSMCEGTAAAPNIAYFVWEPISETETFTDMVVIGGGILSVKKDESKTIPVKLIGEHGLAQPDMTKLSYQSSADGTATVDTKGVVKGVEAGTADITITFGELKATCRVDVSDGE